MTVACKSVRVVWIPQQEQKTKMQEFYRQMALPVLSVRETRKRMCYCNISVDFMLSRQTCLTVRLSSFKGSYLIPSSTIEPTSCANLGSLCQGKEIRLFSQFHLFFTF